MKIIIFSNGAYNDPDFYRKQLKKEEKAYLIAADGGANLLRKLSVIPDLVIGDMDSITKDNLNFYQENPRVKVEIFPVMKDETDTLIAIERAISMKADEVILYGVLGSRFDHSLANIYLLSYLEKNKIKSRIIDEVNEIRLISNSSIFNFKPGTNLSLLPIDGPVEGIIAKGFLYPILDKPMFTEKPYGISNVVNEDKQSISIKKGMLLLVITNE